MVDVFAIIEVAVYIALVSPITYILLKHGRKGILGWLALQSFCFTRIIGNILVLKDGDNSTAATIINSIGLSPLLIGTIGIIHEARSARHPKLHRGREWCFVLNFHTMITVAMVLVVMGVIHMIDKTQTKTSENLMKLGMIITVFCYGQCWLYVGLSFLPSQVEPSAPALAEGLTLLYGVIAALPFIGIRQVYGLKIFIDDLNNEGNSKFATSKPAKYLLSAIPEFLAICIFCFVGIRTRHLSKLVKGSKYTVVEGVGQGYQGPNDDRLPLQYMPPQQGEGKYEPYKQPYPNQGPKEEYSPQVQQPVY
ncbi:hypothetical protein D0Z07_7622 [Hyphodiscus hymeniophilus]|uniref:DUF7702 domain-containing protein n=1 Tax=Hyphodiscus hymeniophilus TaxID=353542 RepID=A0A9P6VEJ3_9HELO|nr:hypothetical protein D0Z07_7622 [Hyphodiscus hymeniophilus]